MSRFSWLAGLVFTVALSVQAQSGRPKDAGCPTAAACEKQCDAGSAAACGKAGIAWADGQGVKSDPLRAVGLLQRACDQGDGAGCARLGEMYARGQGIQEDKSRAFGLQFRACEQNDIRSCRILGRAYEAGAAKLAHQGGDLKRAGEDLARAAGLYQRACEAGSAVACAEAGRLHLFGSGVPADPLAAGVLFQRACDGNDANGCRLMGFVYEHGAGVPADAIRASDAYRKATRAEDPEWLVVPPIPTKGSPAVLIYTEPEGLTVRVDKLHAGVTPVKVTLPPGKHVVEVSGEGFPLRAQQVVAVAGREQTVSIEYPGTLSITSEPRGATVYLQGREVGVTPYESAHQPGEWTVEVRRQGSLPQQKQVLLPAGKAVTENFKLQGSPGAVVIETEPSGAEILLGGQVVGKSPYTAQLSPGEHKVVARLPGYLDASKVIKAEPGKPLTQKLVFSRDLVEVQIRTQPAKARVSVDGAEVGLSPWKDKLPAGDHTVEVTLEGYAPHRETLSLAPGGKRQDRLFTLQQVPTPFALATTPPGAEILIDGKSAGPSPVSVTLTPGTHRVVARLADHVEEVRNLKVLPGQPMNEAWTLHKELIEVQLRTQPSRATLTVNGKEVGPSPWKDRLPPGDHVITVTLDGYAPHQETLALASGSRKQDRLFTLQGLPSAVEVVTTPAGAELLINGKPAGSSPLSTQLPPGIYRVVARLPGHAEVSKTLRVATGQPVRESWELRKELIELKVRSTPSKATVRVDGEEVGVTPWSARLPTGDHTVEVILAGRVSHRELVTLASGRREQTLQVNLAPAPSELSVFSVPSGAEVLHNGKRLGPTPYQGPIPTGRATLEIKLAGHKDVKEVFQVRPGDRVERTLQLVPRELPFQVESAPAGATVLLNGQAVGTTPFKGQIPVGAHALEVRHDGYLPAREQVEVPADASGVVKSFTLSTAATFRVTSTPPGATVTWNGAPLGQTPLEAQGATASGTLTVQLPGFRPVTETLVVAASEQVERTLVLVALAVAVKVESSPPGARITVNGRAYGIAPLVATLAPGQYTVRAVLEEHEPGEQLVEVAAGTTPSVLIPLQPEAGSQAGQAVAAAALEAALDRLKDPEVSRDEKRGLVREWNGHADLWFIINQIEPAEDRGQVCMEWTHRVRKASLEVTSTDAMGDPIPARVLLNGKDVGETPFHSMVPACATEVVVARIGTEDKHQAELKLDLRERSTIAARFGGRPSLRAWTLFGEGAQMPGGPQDLYLGGGVRTEYYGKLYYSNYALKGSTLAAGSFEGVPALPNLEASWGVAGVFGAGQPTRFHLSLSAGFWSLLAPMARLGVALNVKDAFYVTASGHVNLHPYLFVPADFRARNLQRTELTDLWMAGGNLGVGMIFD